VPVDQHECNQGTVKAQEGAVVSKTLKTVFRGAFIATALVLLVTVIGIGVLSGLATLSMRSNTEFASQCSRTKFRQIEPGMTKEHVILVAGEPLQIDTEPNHHAWTQLGMRRMHVGPPSIGLDLGVGVFIGGKEAVFAMPDIEAIDQANKHIDRTAGVFEVLRYAGPIDSGQGYYVWEVYVNNGKVVDSVMADYVD